MSDDRVRIFVSSPADVGHERSLVKDLTERLAQEYLPYFELRAILWEEEALTADRTFQAGLTQPEDCEIVLVILWTRLGSPLPEEPYRGMTGTEWEFVNAVEAAARHGRPEVLVYKKTAPKLVDITDAEVAQDAVADRRRLEAFFREHFFNTDNTFRRAFRTFDNDAGFLELVEVQLRKLLNRRISVERRFASGELRWHGSPFRADRPFSLADERVFTGREQELRDLLARLQTRADAGRGLVLLTGPSGVGKTSLLRAGLLPRLARPYQFAELAALRTCPLDPFADGPTPLAALAARLCETEVLGAALAQLGLDGPALDRLFLEAPALAASQVAGALRLQPGGSVAGTRLVLLIDPLLAGFEAGGDGDGDAATLAPFATALAALVATGLVWVVATLRSDALPRLTALPALHRLLDADAALELVPPPPARIRQVVEIPARIAGIDLTTGDAGPGRGLVELIEAEAAQLRLWAAPVQGLLAAGYRQAEATGRVNEQGELTIGAEHYHQLGGLAGVLLAQAEALWQTLDPATRGALPMLCRALIALDADAAGTLTPRQGDLGVLGADPACARLLAALIAARLVVAEGIRDPVASRRCEAADYRLSAAIAGAWRQGRAGWQARFGRTGETRRDATDGDGPAAGVTGTAAAGSDGRPDTQPDTQPDTGPVAAPSPDTPPTTTGVPWREIRPVVSFTHPALIRSFTPVQAWLALPAHREALAQRFQLSRQARLWKRTECNREYLLREAGHAAAARFASAHGAELEPLERDFLQQSADHLRFQRHRSQLMRGVGLLFVLLFVVASVTAGLAWQASGEARTNLNRSKLKEADLYIARGNTPQAVMLALGAGPDLPDRGVKTLSHAFGSNRLLAMAGVEQRAAAGADAGVATGRNPDNTRASGAPGGGTPSTADLRLPGSNADGSLLATLQADGSARLWALDDGRFVPERDLGGAGLGLHTLIFSASDQVYGIGRAGVWQLPATAASPPLYPCGSDPAPVLALDADRRLLALARGDGLTPDADQTVGVCVVDLSLPGRVLLDLDLTDGALRSLAFAPDGEALITASATGRAHLIDLAAGAVTLSLPAEGPLGRPFTQAVFDADGTRIAIAAADERVRLYRRDGTPIGVLAYSTVGQRRIKVHNSAVRAIAFGEAGAFLVSADDEGQVVRWSLARLAIDGTAQAVNIGSHDLSVNQVRIIAPPPSQQAAADDDGDGVSDSESLVLTASLDHTARLWGLQSGRRLGVLGHDGPLTGAAFRAGGERVVTFSARDASLRLWSVAPVSRLSYRFVHPDHVWHVAAANAPPALAPDGDVLLFASAGFDGGVRVWRYRRGDERVTPKPLADIAAHTGRVRRVAFSADGALLASAGFDGHAAVQDLVAGSGCRMPVTSAADGRVYQVLFAPDSRWLLTTSDDPQAPVRVFDPRDCHALSTGGVLGLAVAGGDDGGDAGGAVGADRQAGPADAEADADADQDQDQEPDQEPAQNKAPVQAAALVPLGQRTLIALGDNAGQLRLLEVDANNRWRARCEVPAGVGSINSVALSLDGSRLGVAGSANSAALFEIGADGCDRLATLAGHSELIYSIAFAPDGWHLVTASQDKTARLWQRDGSPRAILSGHQDRVYTAAFSPDGDWLLTASRDGSIRVWQRPMNAVAGVEVIDDFLPLLADLGGVADAVFTPDGHYIVGAYWQNAALGWRLWQDAGTPPARDLIRRWGAERARLALISDAYRFQGDNRVAEETPLTPAGK